MRMVSPSATSMSRSSGKERIVGMCSFYRLWPVDDKKQARPANRHAGGRPALGESESTVGFARLRNDGQPVEGGARSSLRVD